MEKWYENIEVPLKDVVYILRNNGFNTECSCGHEMYIQCQYILNGNIQELHNLLFNNGFRNYEILVTVKVVDGHQYPSLTIFFKEKNELLIKV